MNVINLDYIASYQLLPAVQQAMIDAIREDYVNPSSQHQLGDKAAEVLAGARDHLAKTLAAKGLNKWRLHKRTGIAYQTLWNWQTESTVPSDESVILVGTYLDLVEGGGELMSMRKKMANIKAKIARLKSA